MALNPRRAADSVQQQDASSFPYHPLVYHLDLSILTYHLYAQSIVWPFDPYYEDLPTEWERVGFMQAVRAWAKRTGDEQAARQAGPEAYRGPGVLNGFPDNPLHDPIVYRYDRLHPLSSSVTNAGPPPDGQWVEYLTPSQITNKIREVYVCYQQAGKPEGTVDFKLIAHASNAAAPNPGDLLLSFEGVTGDKGEPGQPGSQSLMGFVLLRRRLDKDAFDIHIAFRGSRSGDAKRAALLALSTELASGNPDWITDLGTRMIDAGHISQIGEVRRGFARTVGSIYPQVFRCLKEIASLTGGGPDRIFVTGHSLGGALAQHFASAMLLGELYGPNGKGPKMPPELRNWPWMQLKLITFGAPRAGDTDWARTLTTAALHSDFWDTNDDLLYDGAALQVTDPSIVPRLTDNTQPAGFRVLLPGDLITSRLAGGKHVGKTIYLEDPPSIPSTDDHEPKVIRDHMLASLRDPGIPPTAWLYHDMVELNPQRDTARRGSVEEYRKLQDTVQNYFRTRNLWFDQQAFQSDAEQFNGLLGSAPTGPLPAGPALPEFPEVPDVPGLPDVPGIPGLPGLPRP